MPEFEEHCKETEKILGKRFEDVHEFLDVFAESFGVAHRMIFHNTHGVEVVRKFFGEESAKAAEIHIKQDCGNIPKPEDWLDADYFINGVADNDKNEI